jgi:hypothetical protein
MLASAENPAAECAQFSRKPPPAAGDAVSTAASVASVASSADDAAAAPALDPADPAELDAMESTAVLSASPLVLHGKENSECELVWVGC